MLALLLLWGGAAGAADWHLRVSSALTWTRSNNDLQAGPGDTAIIRGDLVQLVSHVGPDDFKGHTDATCSSQESFALFFTRKVVHPLSVEVKMKIPDFDLVFQRLPKYAPETVPLTLSPGKEYYFVAPFDGVLVPQPKQLQNIDQLLKDQARAQCEHNGWKLEEDAPLDNKRPPLPDRFRVDLVVCTAILAEGGPCRF